jgi:hypothetical protein
VKRLSRRRPSLRCTAMRRDRMRGSTTTEAAPVRTDPAPDPAPDVAGERAPERVSDVP